jgi:hypothetical protein
VEEKVVMNKRVLSGLKRQETTEDLRKFQIEELYDFFSQSVIKMIKRRMRQAGHVACMRQVRKAYEIEKKRIVGMSVDKSI